MHHVSAAKSDGARAEWCIRISNLPAYFDQDGAQQSKVIGKIPEEVAIRARYDSEFEQLNPRQIVAFQRTVSEGPISVLQGPPGTGKTALSPS